MRGLQRGASFAIAQRAASIQHPEQMNPGLRLPCPQGIAPGQYIKIFIYLVICEYGGQRRVGSPVERCAERLLPAAGASMLSATPQRGLRMSCQIKPMMTTDRTVGKKSSVR